MLARGPDNVCMLSAATRSDLARSGRWRDCAQPAGVGDELRAAAVDEHGCWASFELYRASDESRFAAEDAQLMRDAARILARRLRQASVGATAERGVDPGQTGVLLIDDDLQPQGFTQTAREWFALLKARQKADHTPLPAHVYAVVGRLLAAEAGDDSRRPPRVRVRTSDARWAIVEAARMDGVANAIAVSVRGAGAEDILSLVARAHGLTARERELVALVLDGLDTRQIAARMHLSLHGQGPPQVGVRQARRPQPPRARHRHVRTSRLIADQQLAPWRLSESLNSVDVRDGACRRAPRPTTARR